MSAKHSQQTASDGIHIVHAYEYADATARLAATGFVAGDVGKIAYQIDTKVWYLLRDHSPITWLQLAGAAIDEKIKVSSNDTTADYLLDKVVEGRNIVITELADGGDEGLQISAGFARHLRVGSSGDPVDYTSVKDAVDYAVGQGASELNQWLIEVCPGTYNESPFTMIAGIEVRGVTENSPNGFILNAVSAVDDLITANGGTLANCLLTGVTDPAKALIRCTNPTAVFSTSYVSFRSCSNGLIASGGAQVAAAVPIASITGAGQGITGCVFQATGAGTGIAVLGGFFSVPSAVLPAYGVNPIEKVFSIDDGARLEVSSVSFRCAPKNSSQVNLLVDGGARASVLACSFEAGYTAVQIGSTGSSVAVVQGGSFDGHTTNFKIDAATGVIYAQTGVDAVKRSLVAGATLTGTLQRRDVIHTATLGKAVYEYEVTASRVSLPEFYHTQLSSGPTYGGAVSAGAGIAVDVSAGEGFIKRTSDSDAKTISWSSVTNLALTGSSTNYVYVHATTEVVTASTAAPSDDNLLLAIVVTSGSGIRFIHEARLAMDHPEQVIHDYLLSTRKIALISGLSVSAGSSGRKFDVGSGSYYRALRVVSYAGATDASFSYFYGSGGATEVTGQTELSNTQYDNAGTLTSMTAGYFRTDTVLLTSDGRVSVIYGSAQYATQPLAEAAPIATIPAFLDHSACLLSNVVVQQGGSIVEFVDIRPQPSDFGGGGGGGVTDHGLLSGLGDDDHTQYLLTNGTRAFSGNANIGGNSITNVNLVDGVDVSGHAARHQPGGADALSTGTPVAVQVGASASAGSSTNLARSDHQHGIAAGTPVNVGTANAAGSASTAARSDHVHAHGNQTSATLHAVATTGANGFMSSADKTKLDGIGTGAGIFGSQAQNAENSSTATTTAGSFQQYMKFTTTSLPAGTYRISWTYVWALSSASQYFNGRVQLDDSNTLVTHLQEPKDASLSNRHIHSGFAYATFGSAGTHDIDIDYYSSGGATAQITLGRIEIWRVS